MEEQNQAQQTQPVQGNGNGFAIAGFVLAFFVPILGIIFSSIGLSKSKNLPNNAGKGLAIAGLVISIVMIVLTVILYITVFNHILDTLDNLA